MAMMFPEVQAARYARDLKAITELLQEEVVKRAESILEIYNKFHDPTDIEWAKPTEITDIDDPEIQPKFREMRKEMEEAINEGRLREIIRNNLASVTSAVNTQFESSIQQVAGVQPTRRNENIARIVGERLEENVQLIKTLPERHFKHVESVVELAAEEGWSTNRLEKAIPDQGRSSDFNAERIARDQTGKLNADLTEQRFNDSGLSKFIWRTAGDSRVRTGQTDQGDHRGLDGHVFTWKEGAPRRPGGGVDVEGNSVDGWSPSGFPGRDIQCRCTAELVKGEVAGLSNDSEFLPIAG